MGCRLLHPRRKDAAKFKDYLLPLLFLKRLSDVFDDEIERLAQEFGDRSIAQEIAESDHELLRFYLPPRRPDGALSAAGRPTTGPPTLRDVAHGPATSANT